MAEPIRALRRGHAALTGTKPAPELALTAMIEAWRGVRDPTLAAAIEALGGRLAAERPPIAGRSAKQFHAEWLARARKGDAVELGVLLPSLAETHSTRALARLMALHAWVPDPRFTKPALALVSSPPFVSGEAGKFWTRLYSTLVACADPRALEGLEQMPARSCDSVAEVALEQKRRTNIGRLREVLARGRFEPDEAEAEWIAKLDAAVAKLCARVDSGPSEVELLEAIYREPGVMAHRHVYADLLQARGDPRGEFIALQLADALEPLGRKPRARMNALLNDYGRAWVGGLDFALTQADTSFGRGFLRYARIKAELRDFDRALDDPAWSTVEVLDSPPLALLSRPQLRALTGLVLDDWRFRDLAHTKLVLEAVTSLHIRFRSTWRSVTLTDNLCERIVAMKALPKVRSLVLESRTRHWFAGSLGWLWTSDLVGERLRRLELHLGLSNPSLIESALAGLGQRTRYERLECVRLIHDRASLRLEPSGGGWRIVVESRGRSGLPALVASELAAIEAEGRAEVVWASV